MFVREPPFRDNPLLKLDNIILSPHMASLTKECTVRMAVDVAHGVLEVLNEKDPKCVVNREHLG